MSDNHSGNLQNEIIKEEHDGTLNAKRVNVVAGTITASSQVTVTLNSTPTLFAVVNTSAAGQSSVVIDRGHDFIGLATVVNSSPVTLASSPNFIGLVTVANTVPTTFSGNITLDDGSLTGIVGNVTISDSKGFIGLTTTTLGASPAYVGLVTVANTVSTTFSGNVTLDDGSLTGIVGNVTLSDSKGFIGLTTTTLGASTAKIGFATVNVADTVAVTQSGTWDEVGINDSGNSITVDNNGTFAVQSTFAGNVTLDDGSLTGIVGNVTLSDSKGFIGLTTTTLGASPAFIGIVTVTNASIPVTQSGTWDEVGINDSGNSITVDGTVALGAGVANIGFASVTPVSAWPDPKTFIGLVTVGGMSTVTLTDSKTYIGLVTATSLDGGSRKTFIHKNIELSSSSIATIYVSTETFKITNVLINSDATVRVSIKSGATYLTGNASIGVTLNPGGGWVENGSPRSPLYYGLEVDQAIVVEKFDMTGTSARVGGKLIFIDE